ncbi:MAG: hypothetical protein ACRD1F_11845 [Terriglobales bacterium]
MADLTQFGFSRAELEAAEKRLADAGLPSIETMTTAVQAFIVRAAADPSALGMEMLRQTHAFLEQASIAAAREGGHA